MSEQIEIADKPVIEISQLTKRYEKHSKKVLNNVDLSVRPGEFLGLLGINGCGKTTLISILCGLLTETSGKFSVCGGNPAQALRQRDIALVPQDVALYSQLTLRENLRFFGRLYGYNRKKLLKRTLFSAQSVQLKDVLDERVDTYSGGMKRRANIAVGLLIQPKIMFLDEPTVNLDQQSRKMVLNTLKTLNRRGLTVILTSHYLDEIEYACSRVAILNEGKVVADDAPSKLLQLHVDCNDFSDVFVKLTGKQL